MVINKKEASYFSSLKIRVIRVLMSITSSENWTYLYVMKNYKGLNALLKLRIYRGQISKFWINTFLHQRFVLYRIFESWFIVCISKIVYSMTLHFVYNLSVHDKYSYSQKTQA